ncbi:hypothetical protein Chor_004202 [Crotalus horridus]
MSQNASSQSLHSQSNLSDAISTGLPASSLMQSQITNGPNHVSMQQSGQNTLPTTSLSMSLSSHGTGPSYSHTVPASQTVALQGQGSIGNYVSRANLSMQSNPGSSQQYMGQEEYYSEQYSHGQGTSESMNQQYYPDANSKPDTNKELPSSKHIPSSNTQINKLIQDNSKDTDLPKELRHNILATNKDRANSTEATELHKLDHLHSNRGLMAMNRFNENDT